MKTKLVILLLVFGHILLGQNKVVIFQDDFTSTPRVSNTMWHIPTWTGPSDGTYFGRTQVRCSQNSPLPNTSFGNAVVNLDTYNPTGFSIYGTDLISNRSFTPGNGLIFTIRAKMQAPVIGGIVGGIFLYNNRVLPNHDEIDFELLTNQLNYVHTNIYSNEPLGAGHPDSLLVTTDITNFHNYVIQWKKDSVLWFVDGKLAKINTKTVPTGSMFFHLNLWAPATEWPSAYNSDLQAVSSAALNTTYSMIVDYVRVDSIVNSVNKQKITLNQGWNIISLNVMPNDSNLMNILQPLINEGKLKKAMDESGMVIEDWGYFGGWQNTIVDFKNTEGYKVNVIATGTLEVTGIQTQLPLDIALNTGWNIISWPSPNSQDAMTVFQSLIDAGKLKKVMDESGKVIEDWGYFGGWQNSIGNLMPGEGYKVNVTSACTLTINEIGTKSEDIIPELLPSTHFIPDYKGNGTDHANINLVNLSESGILEGDEIGIFDGDICVGSAQISSLPPIAIGELIVNQNSIGIPVSALDGIEGKNGYSEGNPITTKLFRDGKEYPLTIQPLNQCKTVFEKGSSLFAQVDLATGLEGIPDSNIPEINCYPNPFNDEITFEIKLKTEAEVSVEVLNQLGQRIQNIVTKKQFKSGVHRLTWNGRYASNREVSPGIYYMQSNIDGFNIHKKIVYSK